MEIAGAHHLRLMGRRAMEDIFFHKNTVPANIPDEAKACIMSLLR
jgi:hypothetical protein